MDVNIEERNKILEEIAVKFFKLKRPSVRISSMIDNKVSFDGSEIEDYLQKLINNSESGEEIQYIQTYIDRLKIVVLGADTTEWF